MPTVDAWIEGRELFVSGAVVTAVLTAFTVGMLAARHHAPRNRPLPSLLAPHTLERD